MNNNAKTISYSLGLLLISLFLFGASIWVVPTTDAAVNVTATVTGAALTVGRIRICDGTCQNAAVSMDPSDPFTIEVTITDPNGWNDINTESLNVQFYTATDRNGCSSNWDCNAMSLALLDYNIVLETANGCTHAPAGGIYCISIPSSAWTTKFLNSDANIYIAVDDNFTGGTHYQDYNALPATGIWTINANTSISEDTTSGTYSGAPTTNDINFTSTQTTFSYVDTNHNGNTDLNFTLTGSDLNVSATVYMGDGNQSWALTNFVGTGLPFSGSPDEIIGDWNRGDLATSDRNSQVVYTWLDIPNQQPVGAYTGTMTYNSSAN